MAKEHEAKFDELIDSGLHEGSCVLFIGPELIKYNGLDYYLAFYNSLPEIDETDIDKTKVKYNPDEKIWSFSSGAIKTRFYIKLLQFLKQHTEINNPLFHKLASLPFPLIVSLIPDDTLNTAFSQYSNFNFTFRSSLEIDIPEPSIDNMVIYNIYGNIKNRKYVVSHFDYLSFILEYSENKGFPINIKQNLKKANYLVFIGFEFDKWYNIFLLYILNMIKQETDKLATHELTAGELVQNLLDKSSLNLFFIEQNNEQFLDDLYNKAKQKNLLRWIVPQKEYLEKVIKTNQEAMEKTKERMQFVEPLEKRKLELDLEIFERDNNELMVKLKNLGS